MGIGYTKTIYYIGTAPAFDNWAGTGMTFYPNSGYTVSSDDYAVLILTGQFVSETDFNQYGGAIPSPIDVTTHSPRIVQNTLLLNTDRFPTASVFGTGAQTSSTEVYEHGVTNGLLTLDSGSAGRAFWGRLISFTADAWYALSFEVTAFSGALTDSGVSLSAGTGTFGQQALVTGANIVAGGIGRYVATFKCLTTGNATLRIGVGLSGNQASQVLTVKNLMLEAVTTASALTPGEFVYPGFSLALDYPNSNKVDVTTKRVVQGGPTNRFNIKKYSNILCVGDSRSDEVTNIPGSLNTLMNADSTGACQIYAEAGWTTANAIGPTTKKSCSLTIDKALSGKLMTRTFSSDGNEEMYNMPSYAPAFDTLLVADFGINSINAGSTPQSGAQAAYNDIVTMAQKAVALGMSVILSDNNPFKANAMYSADKLTATKWLNGALRDYASANGHLFVSTYIDLGDSTDPDKLSDGAGTTPNYSVDGLHLNDAGSTLYANSIKSMIDIYR